MPIPVSQKLKRSFWSSVTPAVMVRVPPPGIACQALTSTLRNTCSSCSARPRIDGRSDGTSSTTVIPWRLKRVSSKLSVLAKGSYTARIARGCSFARAKVSNCWIRPVMRSACWIMASTSPVSPSRAQLHAQEFGIPPDDIEGRTDLMRQARGQLPDHGQPVGRLHLALKPLTLSNIFEDDHRASWSILLANRCADILDQEAGPISAPEHVLRHVTDDTISTRDQDRACVVGARGKPRHNYRYTSAEIN